MLSTELIIGGKHELGLSLLRRMAGLEWPPAWLPLEEISGGLNDAGQYEDTKMLWRSSGNKDILQNC